MSIHIDKTHSLDKRDKLRDLVISKKIGDSLSLYAGYGYKHLVFHCIKMGKKTVNVYGYDRGWYNRIDHKVPVMKVTKDHFTFIAGSFSHVSHDKYRHDREIGHWSYTFRGFLSMGIIPYAGLRYLRKGTLINFSDVEVATFYPMKVSWDGELLSRIPKKAKDYTENCYKEDRDTKNAAARSNYGNTRVVRLMKEAKIIDNWDKVKPMDVFSLTNVTKRTELIEHFGMETILESVPNMRVDEDEIDGRKYELLRFSFPRSMRNPLESETVPATYLKMINPSTGEVCVEGVPNNAKNSWSTDVTMNTVKEALAWRDGDPENIYLEPVALT